MTKVLIAFDKFKDALTAHAAGRAVLAALRETQPGWQVAHAPLADGGEGFMRILTQSIGGKIVSKSVSGSRNGKVTGEFGLVPLAAIPISARKQLRLTANLPPASPVAVIEMATASGLAVLSQDQRDPWQTTTLGTGELIRHAGEAGAVAIILGVGGSATNDLGLGVLAALGFGFADPAGNSVTPPIPAKWPKISGIAGRLLANFPSIHIACDVTNPLLGDRGAAAVYGPQKGLRAVDLARIESESLRLAKLLCAHCKQPQSLMETPGAGAAGGLAFGLMTATGAELLPGFDFVSAWLDLEQKIMAADLIITGEGRFDESSLEGKGPGAVAARALALGKEVYVFAGQVSVPSRPGLSLHAITPAGVPLTQALRDTAINLAATARRTFPL